MAIHLEFINFIVPMALIHEKYPGGWKQCLIDHQNIMGRVWYDEHLFRDGAMNPSDIGSLVEEWTALGFETYVDIGEQRIWKDVCVVDALGGNGKTLPCGWLTIDHYYSAHLTGIEPGKVIGRHQQEFIPPPKT